MFKTSNFLCSKTRKNEDKTSDKIDGDVKKKFLLTSFMHKATTLPTLTLSPTSSVVTVPVDTSTTFIEPINLNKTSISLLKKNFSTTHSNFSENNLVNLENYQVILIL